MNGAYSTVLNDKEIGVPGEPVGDKTIPSGKKHFLEKKVYNESRERALSSDSGLLNLIRCCENLRLCNFSS